MTLRAALRRPLRIPDDSAPTFHQLEFIDDLVAHLGCRTVSPTTRNQASAWITVLTAKRSIRALESLQLRRGDVVRSSAHDNSIDEVVSIGSDGTVYLGRGRRAQPYLLELLAHADDTSAEARRHRAEAKESRSRRESVSGVPLPARLRSLEAHRVAVGAGPDDARLLSGVLDKAVDERPLQRFLATNPACLSSLVRSTYGTFVIALPRLGAEYVPDFAIAHADSLGIHWLLVELESPTAELSTRAGDPSAKLRTAMRQVSDWRDWLRDNLDYARRPESEHGLGLTGIDGDASALVLIGTAEVRHEAFQRFRRRSIQESKVTVHTYSWLVETLRTSGHPLVGPLELEVLDLQ